MKPIDIILCIVILAAFIIALIHVIRNYKQNGCCGDCSKCSGVCRK